MSAKLVSLIALAESSDGSTTNISTKDTVVAHDQSVILLDQANVPLISIKSELMLTERGTIVYGDQTAVLSNNNASSTAISLDGILIEPGSSEDVTIFIDEQGVITNRLTLNQSHQDQLITYQLLIDRLHSDYEHPVQPQCTSPYTLVEGGDSWSVKDDVCRYDVQANIHCTPESPNYNASTEMCTGYQSTPATYSCSAGQSLSGNTCITGSTTECRYDSGNRVLHDKYISMWYWDGKRLTNTSGYTRGQWQEIVRGPYWSSIICGPVKTTIPATLVCGAGFTLSGSTCIKSTSENPTYSCSDDQGTLSGKTLPTCVPSHPHLDPDNEVCRSYENL